MTSFSSSSSSTSRITLHQVIVGTAVTGTFLFVSQGIISWIFNRCFSKSVKRIEQKKTDIDDIESTWFDNMSTDSQKKMVKRSTVVLHHSIVAILSEYARYTDNESLFLKVPFLAEIGFDIVDSVLALGNQSFTGMAGIPVIIHHSVALILEYVFSFSSPAHISWRSAASMSTILLGSGAFDILIAKILPKTPFGKKPKNGKRSKMFYCVAAQLAIFLGLRGYYFTSQSFHLVRSLPKRTNGFSWFRIEYAGIGMMCLFHLLLGIGITATLFNDGYPPKPRRRRQLSDY